MYLPIALYVNSLTFYIHYYYTKIHWFTNLIRSSKTSRKTKMNLQLLLDGNNDRFARGRSSYTRKLARK
jgi:hypothetical protein